MARPRPPAAGRRGPVRPRHTQRCGHRTPAWRGGLSLLSSIWSHSRPPKMGQSAYTRRALRECVESTGLQGVPVRRALL